MNHLFNQPSLNGLIEIVVDGTDCAGKTPLVERLVDLFRVRGWSAIASAPFHALDPYSHWSKDPEGIARRLAKFKADFRREHPDVSIIVWDRGWPTVFVDTDNQLAREAFGNEAALTILLINSVETTIAKMRKYDLQAPYIVEPPVRGYLNRRYRLLARSTLAGLLVYEADKGGLFDYEIIEREAFDSLRSSKLIS